MSDLILIPYIQINGEWTIPDETMKGLYRLMVKEGTARTVWFSGGVKTEDDFLAASQSPGALTSIILTPEGHPAGMVWINNFMQASAQIHFNMFREIWGKRTVEAAHMGLDFFFSLKKPDGEPMFKVFVGLTPEKYRAAIRFIKEVGVTIIGTIPHFLWDAYEKTTIGAVVSYIERRP